MARNVSSIVEAAFAAVAMLILFAVVFIGLVGCLFITVAATDFARVLQTPPPF